MSITNTETASDFVSSLVNKETFDEKTLMLNLEKIEVWIDDWICDVISHDKISLDCVMKLIRKYEQIKGVKPWGPMCCSMHMNSLWPLFELEAEKIDFCGWDCLSGVGSKYLTIPFVYKWARNLNIHELYGSYTTKEISPMVFAMAYHRSGARLVLSVFSDDDDQKIVVTNSSHSFVVPVDDCIAKLLRSWKKVWRDDPIDEYLCPSRN